MKRKIFISTLICLIILVMSTNVHALKLVLDAGHGGKDSGAIYNGVYEKNINLRIALNLRDYLNDYENVEVILTRDNDTFADIFDKAMVARINSADLFISLHTNDTTGIGYGAEAFVSANNSLPKYNEQTTVLANKILQNLSALGLANRGVKTKQINTENGDFYYRNPDGTTADADWYGIIRYAMRGCKMDYGEITYGQYNDIRDGSGVPTILIEHCFINGDFEYVNSEEDLRKLAEADGKAIVDYYGLNKKSVDTNINLSANSTNINSGDKVTVNVNSSTALGAYEVSIVDDGGLNFITSSGQEGSGGQLITGSSISGVNDLATFTFEAPDTTLDKTYNIKIKVSKMETPNNNPVFEKEATITINAKGKEAKTKFVGEIDNEELPNTGLGFLLSNKSDILDGSDFMSLYAGSNIRKNGVEITENTKFVTGDIINVDGTDYTVIIYGDGNKDGKISILDTSTVISAIRGKKQLDDVQKIALDVTKEGKISVLDSTKIINVIRGKSEFLSLLN